MSIQRCCPPAKIPRFDWARQAATFKALADPHRLTILAALERTRGEICVCDFTDALPLNQPTVSHHLRILREAGLIASERRGTWVYYSISPDARARLGRALSKIFDQKVPA